MQYTEEFWHLSHKERMQELDLRKSNAESLISFSQLGWLNDKGKLILISGDYSPIFNQKEFIVKESAIYPTSHDSDFLACRFANMLLTDYVYETGVDPKSIEFILWDKREPRELKTGVSWWERWVENKPTKKTIITQQTIVFIRAKTWKGLHFRPFFSQWL